MSGPQACEGCCALREANGRLRAALASMLESYDALTADWRLARLPATRGMIQGAFGATAETARDLLAALSKTAP